MNDMIDNIPYKEPEGLTLDKAIAYHRQLWDWLSENPDKEKEDWPGWGGIWHQYPETAKTPLKNGECFACYITSDLMRWRCCECILEWPGTNCCDNRKDDNDGLFSRWECTSDLELRVSLAIQIRDLPVRYPAETWNPLEAWRDA